MKLFFMKTLKYIAFAIGWTCLLTLWYYAFFIDLPKSPSEEKPKHIDSTRK